MDLINPTCFFLPCYYFFLNQRIQGTSSPILDLTPHAVTAPFDTDFNLMNLNLPPCGGKSMNKQAGLAVLICIAD